MPRALLNAPFGPMVLCWQDQTLLRIEIDPQPAELAGCGDESSVPSFLRRPLEEYFLAPGVSVHIPLAAQGTPYQRRVWQLLGEIPSGETRTYGQMAAQLGSAARAVGQACRSNPCPIVVPCHRVVARNGLGGFAGERGGRRLAIKRWLLAHEGVVEDRHG